MVGTQDQGKTRCKARKKDRSPCGAWAVKGGDLCARHRDLRGAPRSHVTVSSRGIAVERDAEGYSVSLAQEMVVGQIRRTNITVRAVTMWSYGKLPRLQCKEFLNHIVAALGAGITVYCRTAELAAELREWFWGWLC